MKKFVILISPLLMLFLSTCQKERLDNGLTPSPAGVQANKATTGAVINYLPSGGDDTDGLIQAFEAAKVAGPGSTVQLTTGEYHIGFILVTEFIGSFKGAGMGKTIIIPNMNLDNQQFYVQNLAPDLLKFLRGDIKISGMSFLNLEGAPSTVEGLWDFLGLHDWAYNELSNLPEGHKITAVVDQVEFASNLTSNGWYGVNQAIAGGPDFGWDYNLPYSNTDISVTNCVFRDMYLAFGNLGVDKGKTVFSNNGPVRTDNGVMLFDNLGGNTLISKNEFLTTAGSNCISILDAVYSVNEFKLSEGCQYEISGNIFHVTDTWGAITIANDRLGNGTIDNKNPVLVLIKNNLFDMQGSSWCGIWNWITDDAVIRNNKFTGQSITGIYVDPRTTNSLMLGNNFSNLRCPEQEIDWIPGLGEGFKILLLGNDNTIVGGNNTGTTVLNLGENNNITGAKFANEGENPLGQTIADNYKIWKETLIKMRKR